VEWLSQHRLDDVSASIGELHSALMFARDRQRAAEVAASEAAAAVAGGGSRASESDVDLPPLGGPQDEHKPLGAVECEVVVLCSSMDEEAFVGVGEPLAAQLGQLGWSLHPFVQVVRPSSNPSSLSSSSSSSSWSAEAAVPRCRLAVLVVTERFFGDGACVSAVRRLLRMHEEGGTWVLPLFWGASPGRVRKLGLGEGGDVALAVGGMQGPVHKYVEKVVERR
jgi:hypothetical protein